MPKITDLPELIDPTDDDVLVIDDSPTSNATSKKVTRGNLVKGVKAQIEAHTSDTDNPHEVTAEQVGAASTAELTAHTGNTAIHRSINDGSTSSTALWSAAKISTELAGKGTAIEVAANSAARHSHGNKAVLDDITAPYTAEEAAKLEGVEEGATANASDASLRSRSTHTGTQLASTISDFQATVSTNTDVVANTADRHTHTNKATLDATTASYTTSKDSKLSGLQDGATANSSDAQLRDRSTHTGTQTASTISNFNTAADARIAAQKGQINGLATLDSSGKVPSLQLPSFVDDVREFDALEDFPATGVGDVIYVAIDTTKIYRWSGSTYIEISPSPGSTDAVPEGSTNKYFTEGRVTANPDVAASVTHAGRTDNPHAVTKAQLGLANVDNTSDLGKPVSTAQAAADALALPKAGGAMSGAIDMAQNSIANAGKLNIKGTASANALEWTDVAGAGMHTDASGNVYFGTKNGRLYIRPNGRSSGTNQSNFDPSGNLNLAGTLTLGTDLAIAHGGTGASDAATARANLGAAAVSHAHPLDASSAVISKDDGTGVMTARLQDGTSYTHASDIGTLLNTIFAVLPDPCTIVILPSAIPYPNGAASGTVEVTKDTTIFGYGAEIKCDTDHTGGGEVFKVTVDQKTLRVFGLTIDINKLYAVGIGGGTGAGTYAAKLVHARDVTIKNIYQYGVLVQDLLQTANSELVLENVSIDAGASDSSQECVCTNSVTNVTMRNVKLKGNKGTYISAKNIHVSGFDGDGSGYTTHWNLHLQGKNISVENVRLTDMAMWLRAYASIHQDTIYSAAERIQVNGATINTDVSLQTPIIVETYDDTSTGMIEEVELSNINLSRGEVVFQNFTAVHGKFALIEVSNLKLDTFNANKTIVRVVNSDVNMLRINGVVAPSSISTDSAAVVARLEAHHANVSINELDARNIYPLPTTNMLRATDGGSGKSVTVNISRPLANGAGSIVAAGTPVVTKSMLYPTTTALATKTANYTLTATDSVILADATSGAITMTLPTAVGCTGRQYTIKRVNSGANAVQISTTSSQLIDGASTLSLTSQYQSVTVVSNGTGWMVI